MDVYNHIIIHSKDIIYNEHIMCKDRFDVANTNNADTKVEDSEYVELTDISNFNVCKFIQNDQEVTQDELNTPGNA